MAQRNFVDDIPNAGILLKKNACVVIINTSWNTEIVQPLTNSALKVLQQSGATVEVHTVPGAVELTFGVSTLLKRPKKIDAIIAFGCVIKGDTPHFEYVCQSVTSGLTIANSLGKVPVIFGVLTVNNQQQAMERIAGGSVGDKGEEAAYTAIEMINLTEKIK
jgi:6,7-dimethyl-8-ribityllumazine synthase